MSTTVLKNLGDICRHENPLVTQSTHSWFADVVSCKSWLLSRNRV